jgi:hypothetical protein
VAAESLARLKVATTISALRISVPNPRSTNRTKFRFKFSVLYSLKNSRLSLRAWLGGTLRRFSILILSSFAIGCSLYQSESRKFLEKQAFEYAGVAAQENLVGCPGDIADAEWTLSEDTEDARLYLNDAQEFEMQVIPNRGDTTFKCVYRFASAQEMVEKTQAAIDLTLAKMTLSLQ